MIVYLRTPFSETSWIKLEDDEGNRFTSYISTYGGFCTSTFVYGFEAYLNLEDRSDATVALSFDTEGDEFTILLHQSYIVVLVGYDCREVKTIDIPAMKFIYEVCCELLEAGEYWLMDDDSTEMSPEELETRINAIIRKMKMKQLTGFSAELIRLGERKTQP